MDKNIGVQYWDSTVFYSFRNTCSNTTTMSMHKALFSACNDFRISTHTNSIKNSGGLKKNYFNTTHTQNGSAGSAGKSWWRPKFITTYKTCTLMMSSPYVLSTGGEFQWDNHVSSIKNKSHHKLLYGTKSASCYCTSTCMLPILQVLPPTEK